MNKNLLPEINYNGMNDYINKFDMNKEIDNSNKLLKNYSLNNAVRLIPPHEYVCNECTKMATFIINKKYECWMHYYLNINKDN